jgi:hypothetical protein
MQNQDEHDYKPNQPPSTTDSDAMEGDTGNIKTLLLAIGGLVVVLSILILLPMFLTYLSEGDYRAPSETHATDTAKKSSQETYNLAKPDK